MAGQSSPALVFHLGRGPDTWIISRYINGRFSAPGQPTLFPLSRFQALAQQLLVSIDDNRDGIIQYEELKKHYNKLKDQARWGQGLFSPDSNKFFFFTLL